MNFGTYITYKNKLDFIEKILDIYIASTPKATKLIIREKQALAYYIVYGCNEETIKDIETALSKDINNNYVRMINSTLRKKGYLIKDSKNFKINHLSADMEKIKEHFINKNGKTFTVGFKKCDK